MKKVKFTKDYATFKKGDVWEASRDLMATVVRLKVAKYYTEPKKEAKPKSKK